jgi:hypothetical protein
MGNGHKRQGGKYTSRYSGDMPMYKYEYKKKDALEKKDFIEDYND